MSSALKAAYVIQFLFLPITTKPTLDRQAYSWARFDRNGLCNASGIYFIKGVSRRAFQFHHTHAFRRGLCSRLSHVRAYLMIAIGWSDFGISVRSAFFPKTFGFNHHFDTETGTCFRPSIAVSSYPPSVSTSYDRFWEGRKSFAQLTSNTRSLARLLWVNVALPPTDGEPSYTKGKTPQPDITNSQLRRRKIEALQLCLSFVFATKHYLRAEDGIDHLDYQGIIPPSFMRSRETVSASQSRSQSRYDLTKQNDGSSLVANPPADSPSDNISVYEHSHYGTNKADATKRVRVKRSKRQLANLATPLLSNQMTSNTDLYINNVEESMPLPLVCVLIDSIFLIVA